MRASLRCIVVGAKTNVEPERCAGSVFPVRFNHAHRVPKQADLYWRKDATGPTRCARGGTAPRLALRPDAAESGREARLLPGSLSPVMSTCSWIPALGYCMASPLSSSRMARFTSRMSVKAMSISRGVSPSDTCVGNESE